MHCPKCASTEKSKAGFVKGKQRWRCSECGCQYTRSTPKCRPAHEKLLALSLYMRGQSLRSIAALLRVSNPTVLQWIRQFKPLAQRKPEPGQATVVELDELCTFLDEKNAKYGYGWLFVEKQGAYWTGRWVAGELKP